MERKKIIWLMSSMLFFAGCATNRPPSVLPQQKPDRIDSTFIKQSVLGNALADLENMQKNIDFSVRLLTRYGGESLRIGDLFDIDMLSSRNAYLHLYLFQNSGTVVALTENLYAHAGEKKVFPPVNSQYQLRAHPPIGKNTLLLLATKYPIQGTIRHDGQYLSTPKRIISTQLGAIAEIKNQLRNFSVNEWQSAIQDISVYQ